MKVIEISCVEVWRQVSNYLENDVSPDLRERIEAHLRACAHCKAVVDGTKNVVRLITDGVEYELPEGFSQRLYYRIREK